MQQQQAKEAVDRRGKIHDSLTRDCLLMHETSERISWGMREQARTQEAEARVIELTAQLDRQESRMATKDTLHKLPSAAANGTAPMKRVDTFGASIDHARSKVLPAYRWKASPLSHSIGGAAASPLQIQRVDTFGESLETSSAAAQRARGAAAGGSAVATQGPHKTLQERLATTRKTSALVRGVN